jgi:predicted NAD-dependent protein-ADP-ribosyltransferase YbiA (DUF1768 family)
LHHIPHGDVEPGKLYGHPLSLPRSNENAVESLENAGWGIGGRRQGDIELRYLGAAIMNTRYRKAREV